MSLASIYVLFCVVGLPFWVARQHLGGRSIPFVMATCGYIAGSVIFDGAMPVDNITLIAGCIAAWLCASIMWTDSHKSVFELFNLISYLVLFTAARNVPLALIAIGLFMVGVAFAASQAYYILCRGVRGWQIRGTYFVFGNGNHTGAFMLINFFVCLWLAFHLTVWMFAFLPLIIFALVTSKCKGAILGSILGAIGIMFYSGMWLLGVSGLVALAIAGIIYTSKSEHALNRSLGDRLGLWKAAIELIRTRPFMGFGLNTYAKELPETQTVIQSRAVDDSGKRSHRAHNDHLEIIAEVGAVGYVLFFWLFSSLGYDPILFGLMVAFSAHAVFFYPFREVHTAVPFWAVMGAMAAGTISPVHAPLLAKGVILAILASVAIQTIRVRNGQRFSELAKHTPDLTDKEKCDIYDIALANDPYDGGYLSDAAFANFKVNPLKSFWLMTRAASNYDGTRMKHDILDMYARTIINAKEDHICHWLADRAIYLEKNNKKAQEVKNFLFQREGRTAK